MAALFAVALAAFLAFRSRLIPESFGEVGHYRGNSVPEIAAAPIRYAGEETCGNCHSDKVADKKSSAHLPVRCESCHGPQATHAADPAAIRPLRVRGEELRGFCLRCHSRHESRPRTIKQVDAESHNPGVVCSLCHDPHRPKL